MIPRLSDAIELGHTLIGEDTRSFLTYRENGGLCGCAIGSAYVANGGTLKEYRQKQRERFDPRGLITWLHKAYPWTAARAKDKFRSWHPYGTGHTIAEEISRAHFHGTPRLEIARRVREIEPVPAEETVETPKEEYHGVRG